MDFNETTLKERLDTAVSDLSPDVTTLVGQGQELGRSMRRRRRMQTAGSALAVSVLAIGAFAYTGGAGLFDQNSDGPADTSPTGVEQLMKATPRGMASAVIAHVDTATPFAVAGQLSDPSDQPGVRTIMTDLGYKIDGQKAQVQVIASDQVAAWKAEEACPHNKHVVSCRNFTLADRTSAFERVMTGESANDNGSTMVFFYVTTGVKRDDQIVGVVETVAGDLGTSYTVRDLPIGLETLREIAVDPAVGLSTTQQFIDQGAAIEDFKDTLTTSSSSSSGSGSATAPPASMSVETQSAKPRPDAPTTGN